MNIYTCDMCHKTFPSIQSLSGHKRMHGPSNGCLTFINRRLKPKNIKYCLHCNKELLGKQPKFCNHSCAASHNNKKRIVSDIQKEKVAKSLKSRSSIREN